MHEQKLKAYDFAQESLKQVLTLATGSLGGAIALLDDEHVAGINFNPGGILVYLGLGALVLSMGFGLFGLFNLAGTLEKPPEGGITIYKGSIRLFWGGQLILFVLGLAFLVIAVSRGGP